MILSSEPNTTIDWNLYGFEDGALKQIYSNVEKQDLESEGFKTELLDDYKVKVTGNNFSQTISLLDLGVKKMIWNTKILKIWINQIIRTQEFIKTENC